jgi:PAS domain S-box-containing protein
LELFGYTKEEMLDMDILNIYVNPDDRKKFQQEIEQKRSVTEYNIKFCKKDGTEMDCLLTSTLRHASDGSVLGYQGIIRDVTDKLRMEQELLRMEKLESTGILAGGIAHDFNNILTSILGNATLATMYTKPGEEIFNRLIEVEKASLRAKDLTQQLLTFSKGGAPIKKTTSIGELIKDSSGFALRGSTVKCEYNLPGNLWPVEVDEGQMSQVINNLVINAEQAMPESGTIKITAKNVIAKRKDGLPLKDGKYVLISIKDQGTGIPEEYLKKIFDPYFTTKQKGSGLGLAVIYSIINKHDGNVHVESRLGVGTTFHIYLPASKKRIHMRKSVSEEPIIGGGRILFMDDEEMVRDAAGEILRRIGYEVEFAKDGAEAIELYKKSKESGNPFDAVIVDLTIPGGMGGKEAIKKLLEIDPQVKAVVSSGYSIDPVMANFRKHGFRGVIAKPYKTKEISKLLHKVLKGGSS